MKRNTLSIVIVLFLYSCTGDSGSTGYLESAAINTSNQEVTVEIEAGKVAGYVADDIYIYKGIPYAEAERFEVPQKVSKWEGIKSTRAYGATCPQGKRFGWYSDEQAFVFDWDDGFADEKCLSVNVWTPGILDHQKRPVMVWLHGGGYAAGSGQELPSYDGSELSKKGEVVVVTLNHRLNVLGFLDLSAYGEKYAQSGNLGLLDLVAALEWVRDNIEQFGGDPNNVTIFGQSGGGGKVSTLMATPTAKGLFHKAIVQSGSLLRTMETKYSREIGSRVMEELGLRATQIEDLKSVPYQKLLDAGNKVVSQLKEKALAEGFTPFIFGWAPTVDGNVLPYQPEDPRSMELSKDIPLLVGSTLHEFTASTYNPALRNIDKETAVNELRKKYGDRTKEYVSAFERAYHGYQPKDLLDVDLIFRPAAIKHATLKYNQQESPVYNYLFTWESPVLGGMFRSGHCLELPFIFNNVERCKSMTGGDREAFKLADLMSDAWLAFAKKGDPNIEGLPEWEPFDLENRATMLFDDQCKVWQNHDKALIEIANLFPFKGF